MQTKHVGLKRSRALLLVALSIAVLATVGSTVAYLVSRPDPVSNDFVPAFVTCEIEETFSNGVKQDVYVRNTGNTNAFIRATVVATWVSKTDEKVLSEAPEEGVDFTVTWGESGWIKGDDGFWYHGAAVAPDGVTADLIETATVVSSPEGYRLNLQILATALQAEPSRAVEQAWGVTVTDGGLTAN